MPALGMITALALVATMVWADVLGDGEAATGRVSCPPAPAGAGLTPEPSASLRTVEPLPPAQVAVLVRNSTNRHRLATRVAARLELLGFVEAAPPDNDPAYATGTMDCTAQIRFGQGGRSAARTLGLLAPCAQLVRDGRTDGTVDLVLGNDFDELSLTSAARDVLDALREQESAQETFSNSLQSMSSGTDAGPPSAFVDVPPTTC